MEAKLAGYKKNVERYESEPETGEGKKELMAKAKHLEQERDIALLKDPWFDYAEGLLQLAIVLTSVAIISNRRIMFYAASVLGVVGSVCTLNGYFLFY
jgi:hypothetical protein